MPKPAFVVCVMLGALLMPLGNVVAAQTTNADASPCSKEILRHFVVRNKPESKGGVVQDTVDIWNMPGGKAFFYVSRMEVDADGAPTAYNSKNTGLDDVRNAGGPGNWYGLVTDKRGDPVMQAEGDPFPGFYVSPTSLRDPTIPKGTSMRQEYPTSFCHLPWQSWQRRRGDFATVVNLDNGKVASAILCGCQQPASSVQFSIYYFTDDLLHVL